MSKTESAFGFVALTLLVLSIFVNDTLDFVNGDTYFVIYYDHLLLISSLPFLFFFITVFCFRKWNKPLIPVLTSVHFIATTLLLIYGVYWLYSLENGSIREWHDYSVMGEIQQSPENSWLLSGWVLFLLLLGLTQGIFVLNIILALIKKRN